MAWYLFLLAAAGGVAFIISRPLSRKHLRPRRSRLPRREEVRALINGGPAQEGAS